jgi:hypothetical protein
MHPKRQREIALAVAAILLIAVVVWAVQRGTAPPAAAAPAGATASSAQPPVSKSAITEIDLKALEAQRQEPQESDRNPFRFKPRSAPAPPAAVIRQQQEQAAAAAQAAAAGPSEPPPPPRIPLKYIGEMADPKNPGKRIAILSDTRGTYWGREGEVIEGRYRIERIGVESIELAYLDGRGRQTIRQTGQ